MRHTSYLIAWTFLPLSALPGNSVSVTLYDHSNVGQDVLQSMQRETSRIFEQAGLQVAWVECEIAGKPRNTTECARLLGPTRLMLQLSPGANRNNPTASGIAMIQDAGSVFACIYPDRIKQLARDAGWAFGELLGHAVAHELGHLLLRSSGHSSAGVMRGRWETDDLRKLSHAGLIFLPGQLDAVLHRLQALKANVNTAH